MPGRAEQVGRPRAAYLRFEGVIRGGCGRSDIVEVSGVVT